MIPQSLRSMRPLRSVFFPLVIFQLKHNNGLRYDLKLILIDVLCAREGSLIASSESSCLNNLFQNS